MASEATSSSFTSSQSIDLWSIFRIDYPDKDNNQRPGARKTRGRRAYICLHCTPEWINPNRFNASHHARTVHKALLGLSDRSQQPIDSYITPRSSEAGLRNSFNRQRYIEAIIGLLTRRRVAFSAVEWDELRDLALACNPAIEDLLVTSRRSILRHIDANFLLYTLQLKEKLQSTQSLIHISSDLWSSPHRHAMLAVCAQWVDQDYQLQKALLGLPECRYSHSGERQAELIFSILEGFGITKIGYHTSDNASSNDTCLVALSNKLQAQYRTGFNAPQRRIRCIGHIINLSLQAFLLAQSKEALNIALAATSHISRSNIIDQFSTTLSVQEYGWQGISSLQKLHNIAVWLRSSSIHSDRWDEVVGIRLGIDNNTRWSSWYQVIDRTIKRKPQITQFLTDNDEALTSNVLTGADWDLLSKTHQFLQPFALATLYGEGDRSSISQSLVLMDALLNHYERSKEQYSKPHTRDTRLLHAIDMGWFVLDKYYTMSDDVPVYAAALLLDPSKRAAYMYQNWPQAWHSTAIDSARQIWETQYYTRVSEPTEHSIAPVVPVKHKDNQLDQLLRSMEVKTTVAIDRDCFETFVEAVPTQIDCTPLEWWCRIEQRRLHPRLSRMAIDILSIPPESAEAERTFSGARRTASWDRSRLTCTTLMKIECIGNWLREGHIVPSSQGGMGLVGEPQPEESDMEIDVSIDEL
jgi:hypothetical protein